MILSIDTEKDVDKIHHPFMIKALRKLGIEEMLFNIIKATNHESTANVIWRLTEAIPPKVNSVAGISTFPTPIQYSF
jgi:hypothetical protein